GDAAPRERIFAVLVFRLLPAEQDVQEVDETVKEGAVAYGLAENEVGVFVQVTGEVLGDEAQVAHRSLVLPRLRQVENTPKMAEPAKLVEEVEHVPVQG